uniref:E3 ubiquitin protein ligase n=1 Tax=Pygocentrus nattereri TaxID=42514 RepID=A0AAR2LUI5_PYGNA
MSAQKRPSESGGSGPAEKRRERDGGEEGEGQSTGAAASTAVETVIKLGGIANSEEQDIKALQVKNRKLGEALDQRQVIEDELRERVERLETRQATDDASLLILNRYWNQGEAASSFLAILASSSSEEMEAELQERVESSRKQASRVVEIYESLKSTVDQLKKDLESGTGEMCSMGQYRLVWWMKFISVLTENNSLLCDSVHLTFQSRSLGRAATRADNRISELQVLIEELQWDTEKVRRRENRLNTHLGEVLERVSVFVSAFTWQFLQMCVKALGLVRETAEYRCLQSQFSVLYNESLVLKAQLDETRARLNTTRAARLRQLDHMENDEVSLQRKVRTEVIQLEDTLAQVRKEYEMLRIEFEQTLAANEQAGPINREMRHLISTLQTHNQQMKGEVVKYKLRLREAQQELNQTIIDWLSIVCLSSAVSVKTEPGTELEATVKEEEKEKEKEKEEKKEKEQKERERAPRGSSASGAVKEEKEKPGTSSSQSEDSPAERCTVIGGPKRKEVEQLKIVRAELKKAQESQREMKLLLDMYRSAPKEQRDKVQLMAAEKKAKAEAEELRQRLRDLEERERREGKKMADEEALRKIRSVEEQIDILNKKLSLAKQEEDALLSEMDVTGQAFEDMQEQNIRLMQQLREKDDANFKLMSERIKSNQIHKLLKEEKEELADQLLTLKTQVDAQLQVVRKLEEKERLLQGTISAAERELALRTQALDMNKRKAQESALLSEDVRSQLESVQQRLTAVREEVIENSISREKESFNARRAQEDISKLRRKIEKAKKPAENIRNGDEILNQEIIEYKARLTCPCCNSRMKDAVLTKCFHVFCFECVKTRYDTRQRKCPKCNAAFGANDFHRIYIG